jgi:hypothetical protein
MLVEKIVFILNDVKVHGKIAPRQSSKKTIIKWMGIFKDFHFLRLVAQHCFTF